MVAVGLLVALALTGCGSSPNQPSTPSLATEVDPTHHKRPGESDLAAETRALAERLAATIDSDPSVRDPDFDPFANDPPLPNQPASTSEPIASPTNEAIAWTGGADPATPPANTTTPISIERPTPPMPAPLSPSSLSRGELLDALADQLGHADDPAMATAITAAALSLADPSLKLDPSLLEPLKPLQRESVQRLHQLFVDVYRQSADPSSDFRLDRPTLDAALAEAFGNQPIGITRTEFCRSVAGFGVFEPFETHNFLSGQQNRAIVYVEVDSFTHQALDNDQQEVRLTQELILYKENDGLAVWRHEPTQIVDVSRNRRRDFYIVQMITLPARLSEGRYRLKVRVTDQHGNSVDETTMKLNIVADPAMLRAKPVGE